VVSGGLSEISRLAEFARRAEAMSAFFAAAYLGLGLPVVLGGRPAGRDLSAGLHPTEAAESDVPATRGTSSINC
jgi:hypothetical protein